MRIGVFDSGVGGNAVADKLSKLIPGSSIILVDDHANVPYGTRSAKDVVELTDAAIQPLIKANCDAIVIACNTATTVAIEILRKQYPKVKFIGIEPMIKTASSITRTNKVAVLATVRTLQSRRYLELKHKWAKHVKVYEPDCRDWAEFIEIGKYDQLDIEALITTLRGHGVDVIVLGCTHYHLVKERIVNAAGPNITVLEPTDAIANRIVSILD